jgi:hypothetical protein
MSIRVVRARRAASVSFVCGLAAACGQQQPADSSDLQQFFEQSTRRDPDAFEAAHVVNLNGCAAFFVENTAGKTILGTARHCVSYSITSWCSNGGTIRDNNGRTGRCTRVVAADTGHDIALFEASLPYTPTAEQGLRLAAYQPPVNTRLQMIGYPADQYRHAALTLTENCWVLQTTTRSPHADSNLQDRSSLHNCTTYGGNSGGPMIREGDDVVIGLPFTYQPNDYHLRSATDLRTAAHLAQMADYVETHRTELENEGIVVAD